MKAVSDQIEELKKEESEAASRCQLTWDICKMLTKAETKHAIKYVTEANSLRHTVKEKAEEFKIVQLQLDKSWKTKSNFCMKPVKSCNACV